MNPPGQFVGKNLGDHPVAVETRPALERRRDDLNTEMGFTFGTRTDMALMPSGFVDDLQPRRRQCRRQLSLDGLDRAHSA